MSHKPVYVTKPSLADLSEYMKILEGIWERGILTHNGPLVQEFEREVCSHFELPGFVAVSNGTIALQMAIKALGLKGEIITTPFTWIATVSAIKWEGCKPVFCDIDADTLNLDPSKLEDAITDQTSAIMPVHVFGNPCDVDEIERIAKKHQLKVIYDAAHAIGSVYKNRSLLRYGDISATSLHATKILNTAEGGGCVSNDPNLVQKLRRIRFFGHDHEKEIVEDGFNGKMTEIHAGLGLVNIKHFHSVLAERVRIYHTYINGLKEIKTIKFQKTAKNSTSNYAYFPLILESQEKIHELTAALENRNIYARRYFYPSVNRYRKVVDYQKTPIAESISDRILCLPSYSGLEDSTIKTIIEIVKEICCE
ncbi:MAG: DegT/DnrJ/EryC1/StrS family aminotransferase [Balneolaceae bacterium]